MSASQNTTPGSGHEMSPYGKEFIKFAEEFATESDRAAVILGAAKLDLLLQQILEAHLLPSPSGRDELLEGDSPLATFSARINACYRLGLITAGFSKALHLIRRIRNSFAHESTGVSLDAGAHADRVKELTNMFQQHGAFCWILDEFFKKPFTSSKNFRAAVALLCLRLDGCFENTKIVTDEAAFDIIPPAWDKAIAAIEKKKT